MSRAESKLQGKMVMFEPEEHIWLLEHANQNKIAGHKEVNTVSKVVRAAVDLYHDRESIIDNILEKLQATEQCHITDDHLDTIEKILQEELGVV